MHIKRNFPRIRVNHPTYISGESDAESFIEGRCCSIGGGGFGFLTNHPFAVGSWVTIEVNLESERLNARAVVVGCEADTEDPSLWRVATRLEELPEEDQRRLDSAISAAQK
ncbi:MAG: PilZ domain-containing protein [Pyrinomonadaceae bacterium]|nr:PilZ domain-containing protein [Pyrinomonadaceae bacterium]